MRDEVKLDGQKERWILPSLMKKKKKKTGD